MYRQDLEKICAKLYDILDDWYELNMRFAENPRDYELSENYFSQFCEMLDSFYNTLIEK